MSIGPSLRRRASHSVLGTVVPKSSAAWTWAEFVESLRHRALHEAGHAIVQELVPASGFSGRCIRVYINLDIPTNAPITGGCALWVSNGVAPAERAIVALAGTASQMLHGNLYGEIKLEISDDGGSDADYIEAARREVGGDQAWLDAQLAEATRLVNANDVPIKILAGYLLLAGSIDGDVVRWLVQQYGKR